MALIVRDFCDVIAPGLSLISYTITGPNNCPHLYALRLCMDSTHPADAHLPFNLQRPMINVLDLPLCHTRSLAIHTVKVSQIVDMPFNAPPEQSHIRSFSLRSPGMDMDSHWDFYLTRESIRANEGKHIYLLHDDGPIVIKDQEEDSQDTASAPVPQENAVASIPQENAVTPIPQENAVALVPQETAVAPIPREPTEGPVAQDDPNAPVAEETGSNAGQQSGRESPELLDMLGLLLERTRSILSQTTEAP